MRRRSLVILALASALVLQAVGSGAQAASEKKRGGGESYLQFPILTATVAKPGGRRGVLTVETGVDVPDAALRTRADQLQPRLRDAYLRVLLTYAASLSPGALPSPDYISLSLQRATDEVLGKPGAKLLLGTVLEN